MKYLAMTARPGDRATELLGRLTTSGPVLIPSVPGSDAGLGLCYANVAAVCRAAGGRMVTGWSLWELPGVYYFAEHHAVWRRPGGALACVTPQLGDVTEILFAAQREWGRDPTKAEVLAARSDHFFPARDGVPLLARVADLNRRRHVLPFGSPEHRRLDREATALIDQYRRRGEEWAKARRQRSRR